MPAIFKSNEHMQVVTYTGTGAARTIICGFKPDLVWIKSRSATTSHKLTDSVRGVTKGLISNANGAETTDTNGVTAFTDFGFTIGSDSNYNTNGATYVAWCWKAGQGTNITNTNGSITSTVSVNASAGFSVVTYTGTGVAATVGHGLSVAPKLVISKLRSSTSDWPVYHSSLDAGKVVWLNLTNAQTTSVAYNNAPTSAIINIGTGSGTNTLAGTYVAYCWAPIEGYSAFGSYTGNNNADGPFVYLGFRPKFIMRKGINTAGINWSIIDTSRNAYNVSASNLFPNLSDAESTPSGDIDITSNGFKVRSTSFNISSETYIYAAFAENPFKNALAR